MPLLQVTIQWFTGSTACSFTIHWLPNQFCPHTGLILPNNPKCIWTHCQCFKLFSKSDECSVWPWDKWLAHVLSCCTSFLVLLVSHTICMHECADTPTDSVTGVIDFLSKSVNWLGQKRKLITDADGDNCKWIQGYQMNKLRVIEWISSELSHESVQGYQMNDFRVTESCRAAARR